MALLRASERNLPPAKGPDLLELGEHRSWGSVPSVRGPSGACEADLGDESVRPAAP